MSWGLLVALLGIALAGGSAQGRSPGGMVRERGSTGPVRPHRAARARVKYLSPDLAYLGAGSQDGVQPGAALAVFRRNVRYTNCQVLQLAEHFCACHPARPITLSDEVELPPPPPAQPPPPRLAAPPSAAQLARQRDLVESAHLRPVEFQGTSAAPLLERLRAELDLTDTYWLAAATPDGSFHEQRLDLAVRGADLGAGFQAWVDLTVLNWSRRPAEFRFSDLDTRELFVRQLELSFRRDDVPITAAVGRILPWHTPGMGSLDGAQAGWKNGAGTLEVGAVGGTSPNAVTAASGLQSPLGGLYASASWTNPEGWLRWAQMDVVASALTLVSGGQHYTLDALGMVSLGAALDGDAELRLGAGTVQSPGGVEAARLDLHGNLFHRLQLAGSVRYFAPAFEEAVETGDLATSTLRSLQADASVVGVLGPVTAGLVGGYLHDFTSVLGRGYVGPQLSWPTLFGHWGGAAAGYELSAGWMQGQDVYGQAMLTPLERLHLTVRGSFSSLSGAAPPGTGLNDEGELLLQADYRLGSLLELRGSLLSRSALLTLPRDPPLPWGVIASGTLAGRF